MKILIAPDSFKGSMTAAEVAECICQGVKSVCPEAIVKKLALSDGGEGLVDCLVEATGGDQFVTKVTGPMGEPVEASWGILGDQVTAVIEMASASGLMLIQDDKRDPRVATTYGTGELISAAINRNCTNIILGLGGSATNDGGSGMVQALGAKLLNKDGKNIDFGGNALRELDRIDVSEIDERLKSIDFQVACDVDNILTGENGASHIFAPQKGATPSMVVDLDRALRHYAKIIKRDLNKDVEFMPGAGAAGGVGAGVVAFLEGSLTSGIELVIKAVNLQDELADCDLVITGEGKLDEQSFHGKVPVGIARLAKKFGVPVVVIAGNVYKETAYLHSEGVTAYFSIINEPMSLDVAMTKGKELLEFTTNQLLRFYLSNSKFSRIRGNCKKPTSTQ